MYDESVPTFLRQRQSHQLLSIEHTAADEPGLVHHSQHLLRQFQLIPCLGVVPLGELPLVIRPEAPDSLRVLSGQASELRIRTQGTEFLDVVPLTGVPPPGKELQVLPVIHIVPPGTDVADADIGIPGQQPGCLTFRHHGDHRQDSLLQTVLLDGGEGGVLVSLRTGHRVVEHPAAIMLVPHHQAPGDLRPGGVQHRPPHQLSPHGILAETIFAIRIILPQFSAILYRYGLKLVHKLILFLIL